MRLGLYGGSFDPIHYGHLLLAESCREQCRLDRVLFLPAAVPPHKRNRELTEASLRVEMLELALGGHEAMATSRYEIDRGGVSYTVETLRHFRTEYPEAELFLLMGADMLLDLPHWREAAEVCRLATLVTTRRAGVKEPDLGCISDLVTPEQLECFGQHQVEMPWIGLSSTEIRRRVAQGQNVRFRIPRAVEEYIKTHQLYRELGE